MKKLKYLLALIILICISCSKYYIHPGIDFDKSYSLVKEGKAITYEDSIYAVSLKAKRFPANVTVGIRSYDLAGRGLMVDMNTIEFMDLGLSSGPRDETDIVMDIYEDDVTYVIDKGNEKCATPVVYFCTAGQSQNDYFGSGIPVRNKNKWDSFKIRFDVLKPDSTIYKKFDFNFSLFLNPDDFVFWGKSAWDSRYKFDFVFRPSYYGKVDSVETGHYDLEIRVKNVKSTKSNNTHTEVVIDSLTIKSLNLPAEFGHGEVKETRSGKETIFLFNDIEIPYYEDMVRVEFTIYRIDRESGRKFDIERHSRPMLVIPPPTLNRKL
jgi:hypothetical protein